MELGDFEVGIDFDSAAEELLRLLRHDPAAGVEVPGVRLGPAGVRSARSSSSSASVGEPTATRAPASVTRASKSASSWPGTLRRSFVSQSAAPLGNRPRLEDRVQLSTREPARRPAIE